MASVTISNVGKAFGTMNVLRDINIDIENHEFVVLVGPSGCGKSTLLRMIAGLETVSNGEVRIGERVVNDVPARERDIAMVFQNYALYPHMTSYGNMSFSLRLRKRPQPEIDQKVRDAAATLNLLPFLERSPRQLSGGQRQRVAMGRALVREAQVFLYDEPLSNLDAKLRVVMRTEIKALHQRLKTTSIYVTHDQIEAMTMADRIVVMNGGRIEQIGAPLDLYDRPGNLFVAGFLGSPSMNFLKGRMRRTQGKAYVETEGGIGLPVSAATAAAENQPVICGIRPEHIAIAGEGGLPVTVDVVEPTGPNIEVFFSLAGQNGSAVFTERHKFRPGDRVALHWQPEHANVFDAETGVRL